MIKVENLTRKYGDLTAVDQVSFEIAQGEIVGLLGHNGAGKTTIMKMLTGFLEPTSGTINVDGLDIHCCREQVQANIGYLPENCPLYPEMTVVDYLDYAASLHGVVQEDRSARIRDAIELTELKPKAMAAITTLSRGFRQRVGVAQAILHRPKILILDEPTNGLDPTQIKHMRGLIKELSQKSTVIISTHILHEVQAVCDRVIIIHTGRKVLDSRLDQLRYGNRLLLITDAKPDPLLSWMRGIDVSVAPELVSEVQGRYQYALATSDEADPLEVAPAVASAVVTNGCKLFSLTPESRDLETIFGEISAR